MRTTSKTLALALLLAACQAAPAPAPTLAPDLGKRLVAERAVVTSAHPAASDVGVEILRRGGNAVDAAVATAFAVSVGEPQMSGLGGGGSMLIWLQREQRAEYIDFYSASRPASWTSVAEGAGGRTDLRIVAVPGQVAGLLEAHERFGRLSRADVVGPAIRLAEEGVPVNQVLAQMIQRDSAKLARYPESSRVFLPGGRPLRPGEILRQPELAASLRRVAERGRAGFYEGELAGALVRELNAGGHPATLEDLAAFRPQWKRPLCGEYRGRAVLSAPPPQTGMQILQTLALLEPHDLRALGLPTRSAHAFDVLASAFRVGMADARHIDDPNWADVPAAAQTSRAYAASRARWVGSGEAGAAIEAGDPAALPAPEPTPGCRRLQPYGVATSAPAATTHGPALAGLEPTGGETTHLSVVDAEGNAVALTHTNSSLFGSGARVAGFFLNDSGIDFTRARADAAGGSHEWRIRRSTISPTIVVEDGRVRLVVGAPGGGRIPTAILQSMIYTLDYGLDPLEALRMPRIFPSPTTADVQLETGFDAEVLRQVREMGYAPAALSFGYARLYMIARQGGRWVGVADPRHNGEVRGY
jgi:gamma-glutamyltranspeptidase / glutathione hydrolase